MPIYKNARFSLLLLLLLGFPFKTLFAQQSADTTAAQIMAAILADDSLKLSSFITNWNVNDCYGTYSLLSQAIRNNAPKCFALLISDQADVNKSCDGYVPPLMHAAKYGHLDMVKVLINKGADPHYTYHGAYTPAEGMTPLTYAQKYKRDDVVAFLQTIR